MADSDSIKRRQRATQHRLSASPTYAAWENMIQRCTNPNSASWLRYGGRGITVCARWSDFRNFLADMGERPSSNHSLDRIDNDSGYHPENCKWATKAQQCNNKSNNIVVDLDGKLLTLKEASMATGISYSKLQRRYANGERPPDLFRTALS